ncbi:hypothetical protein RN001_000022 [Aquatica leii]|uniref:Uncharacterized protein n=1 Tax=Aquatica leii TaxID=1421715 RepID=A0AAN7PJG2_9COLE|nr:hypothetical protein RN001_000022 [Aquatica leii]
MYSYTFYCALFLCCAQVFSLEIPDTLFDKEALECLEKLKLEKSFIQESVDEKLRVHKDDKNMYAFLECVAKAKTVVQEDGTLNNARVHDQIMNVLIPLLNKSGDKHEMATKVFSVEIPDNLFDKDSLECLKNLKLEKSFIEKSIDEKFHVHTDNKNMNAYLECVGKAKNVVQEDGTLNHARVHDLILHVLIPLSNKSGDKHDMATKVTDECIHTIGDTYGEQMANLHNCGVDGLAKH